MYQEIGLEYILRINNMKNVELAEKLGCSKNLISAWTSGRKKIADKRLKQLTGLFNFS